MDPRAHLRPTNGKPAVPANGSSAPGDQLNIRPIRPYTVQEAINIIRALNLFEDEPGDTDEDPPLPPAGRER